MKTRKRLYLLRGGQGRDLSDVQWSAWILGACMVIAAMGLLAAVLLSGCAGDLSKFNGM